MDRNQLRHNLLNIRNNLDVATQQQASHQICVNICKSNIFLASKNLACYLATKGEVDVGELIHNIWLQQKNCYLPLLDPEEKRHLCFVPYNESDRLVENKHHILQPVYDKTKAIVPQEIDLVIVPLVGFDTKGNRLGQGGGYYDYTFAFRQHMLKKLSAPYLLGVAYEWQKVDALATFSWDVRLDAVVTEENWYL